MLEENNERILDIKRVIGLVLSRWYVIVLFIAVAMSIAYINLRYTIPVYEASIDLRFEDDKGNSMTDLFRFGRSGGRIENQMKTETEIIKSRTMVTKTISSMNIPFTYELKGNITKSKLYPNTLFAVDIIYYDSANQNLQFNITFINKNEFTCAESGAKKVFNFNDTLLIGTHAIRIRDIGKEGVNSLIDVPIKITKEVPLNLALSITGQIDVEAIKGTSLFNIKFQSEMPQFAVDFVNALATTYINEQVTNKALAAEQTLKFIGTQLDNFAKDVEATQKQLSSFKSVNKGVSPDELSKVELGKLIKYESDKVVQNLNLELVNKAIKEVQSTRDKPIEVVTLDGAEGASIARFKELLNSLILERLSLQQLYGAESKRMKENELKIINARDVFLKALYSARSQLIDRINDFNKQISAAEATLSSLPSKQLDLVNLERNYRVNEKIFSYLLEKRLETMLQRASIIPNTTIVDTCLWSSKISPKPEKQYLIAFGLGLALSIGLIALLRLLYDKIPDKETIESMSKTPVIGIIKKVSGPKVENDYDIHALNAPKSIFSESIRGIRTNINFLLGNETHKLITLTSTVSGEGKTFCTLNIAASLTLLGNKVVIIGCDLRRPKLHLSFPNMDNRTGLTTYLFGKHQKSEVIQSTTYENLYIIPAGPVPPNPSELLQSDKMMNLLAELKQEYDYVFLDTSPVGLVSDSLTLMKLADINIYVLRAQYSKRDFALIPDRLKTDSEIPNLYTILNAFDPAGAFYGSLYKNEYGGYYGGGGYYYSGGYYGRGAYGSRKYQQNYYSGYYDDAELNDTSNSFTKAIKKLFRKS